MNAPAGTWSQVHVGDEVRGSDQRVWSVIARDLQRRWLYADRVEARFELELGERRVTTWRPLRDPAPFVRRADHSALHAAFGALIDNGITPTLLEESMTSAEPMAAESPVKHDRYGRYLLPDPVTGVERGWTRATTVARVLADEYNLARWGERMVAKGMALRPDLVAGAAAADVEQDKSTLNDIAQQAKDQAGGKKGANLGTATHTFIERLDRGEPLTSLSAPPNLEADLRAYGARLDNAGLRVIPEYIERVVVNTAVDTGGRIDRMTECAHGLRILDLKTAKSVEYSWLEIAIQLAIYANAEHAWNPATQSYDPMPDVDKRIGYVLHLPIGKADAQLYQVNLVKGWQLAQIAVDVKAARGASKKLARLVEDQAPVATVVPPGGELSPQAAAIVAGAACAGVLGEIAVASTRQTLAQLWETYNPQGLWTPEVHEAAQARLLKLA